MKKKILAFLTSAVVIMSLVMELCIPASKVIAAEDDTDSEETAQEDKDLKNDGSEVDVPLGQLIAHWTFDDNYNESVRGMVTQLGGKKLTYTQGILGKAAVFNGKDTYLYVKDSILNLGNSRKDNNDNFTISAWVNLGDSKSGYKYLVDKGKHIGWSYNDDCNWNNPYAVLFDGSQPFVDLSNEFEQTDVMLTEGYGSVSGKYVDGNEWFLETVTYDGKIIKIYHNDQLLTQSNYTSGITFNNDELFIGCDGYLENFFKGAIDDLRIYTKTLSYDDVGGLYAEGLKNNSELLVPTKDYIAYYPFDGNMKDISDYKNDAEAVAANGKIKYVVGMSRKAISLSKGSYIRIPAADQLDLSNEFSIYFWLNNTMGGEFPVLYRQNPSFTDNNDNDYTYSLYLSSWNKGKNGTISFYDYLYTPDNWSPEAGRGLSSDFTYKKNKIKSTGWNHYAYTYKDGQLKCYINGELQTKSDKSDLIDIANASGDLLIGYDGDKFLTGTIDNLVICGSCLSADVIENKANEADSISLDSADSDSIATIGKGNTVALTNVILSSLGTNVKLKINDKDITYKTSNKSIMTVSSDGKLTGVKAGKAKLVITYGPHKAVYDVTVE